MEKLVSRGGSLVRLGVYKNPFTARDCGVHLFVVIYRINILSSLGLTLTLVSQSKA